MALPHHVPALTGASGTPDDIAATVRFLWGPRALHHRPDHPRQRRRVFGFVAKRIAPHLNRRRITAFGLMRPTNNQISISNMYSPPAWRSTVYTMRRSSTKTSLSWMVPCGARAGAGGTKAATSLG